jgi:hypothetical protein
MPANKTIIRKFEKKADKELEKRSKLQKEYSERLLDTKKGIIRRRELIEEIEPLGKEIEKQKKRVKNAEMNLQRATKRGNPRR